MKRIIKITALSLTVFILLLALTGCGEVQKAEKTVAGMFEAYKRLDFETAKKYVDISKMELTDDKEGIAGNTEMLMKNLFNKLNYKIISSEKIDNETVIVKTEITAIDMKPVMEEYMSNSIKFALTNAFTTAGQKLSDAEVDKKMEEIFVQSVNKPNLATVTNTVDIKVVKSDKKWKVVTDDTFTNALFGGLLTVVKDMGNSFNQNTE